MNPSLDDLFYFDEVAREKNLSRAASRLGISQPSLTLAMQRLERTIGVPLLVRSKKGVFLTPAGQRLLEHSKQLVETWENVRTRTIESHTQIKGRVTLGCHPSVALYSLPLFLSEIMHNHPELEIKLEHNLSRIITEDVIQARIDLGIVINPLRHPDLVISELAKDTVTLWKSSHCSNKSTLIYDPELLQTQSLLKKIKKNSSSFNRTITSSNLEVIAQLTNSGCGVGILPTRVAKRDPHANIHPIKDAPRFQDSICCAYRVENQKVATIRELSEHVKRAFKNSVQK